MKRKTILIQMAMKTKTYYVILFLLFTFRLSANNKDSLLVYLVESDSVLSVDIVFENISTDTVIISGKFKNFYSEWESSEGIGIRTYSNGKIFTLANYGDMQSANYIKLSNARFIFLPPRSKMKFNINLSRYFYKVEGDLSVILDINYNYIRYDKNPKTMSVTVRKETNCVKVKNPCYRTLCRE